jgi:hypothetical protein
MVKYAKKVEKKIMFKKKYFFMKTQKKILILLKFHFETIESSIGFILNQLQNFKTFGIIKVRNKCI